MIKEECEAFSSSLSFLPSCHPPKSSRISLPNVFLVLGQRRGMHDKADAG